MAESQRVKILYVITQGELGGAQRYVFDLAKHLPARFEPCVAVGAEKLELQNRLARERVKVLVVKNLVRAINPLRDFLAVWELKKIINKLAPDIIHLNSTKAGILGSFAARLSGLQKRTVFTAHGFAFLERRGALAQKFYFFAEKLTAKFRKKIICVSGFDRRQALDAKLCAAAKLVTVHNGINLAISQADPNSPSLPPLTVRGGEGGVIVGTIANFYKTKGLSYLIDAVKILNSHSNLPSVHFFVIGDGPERKTLEQKIKRLGLTRQITLLGNIENASQYLPAFNLFVLPSLKEGFPYVILEAMATSRPIVATAVGGIPEVIESGREGLLVPPQDPQALAEAIFKLLHTPNLAEKMGQNAAQKIKNFTIEKMLEKTIAVYQEILSSK